MIVAQADFYNVLDHLASKVRLGLDTETTGLRAYHGHELFSIIVTDDADSYYFNFNREPDHLGQSAPDELTLPDFYMGRMQTLFDMEDKIWFIQNAANFDMGILAASGLSLAGHVHCTKAIGRVVFNDYRDYSLEAQGAMIGCPKSPVVEEYVAKHKLYTDVKVEHRIQRVREMHYEKVPFEIMSSYGEQDGRVVYALGVHQERRLAELDDEQPEVLKSGRSLANVLANEKRLQKTIFRMKQVGVRIDKDYCTRAAAFEKDRELKLAEEFQRLTGEKYQASSKLFERVFAAEQANWSRTKKGNPSFDADAIAKLKHPAAGLIVSMRDADTKRRFYLGFLYHADAQGNVHPNFNPEGVTHGRFSSSEPNFQNLKKDEDNEETLDEFQVRRAVVPRPGYVFCSPDYEQMEYKFALEMGCRVRGEITQLGKMVRDGFDFHDATGKLVLSTSGIELIRKHIKNTNFLTLYGGGDGALADLLGIPIREARVIRNHVKQAAPEIQDYIRLVTKIAEERKYVINWLGRRSHFPWRSMSYKACNYLVSGGCADIVKIAMNRIDDLSISQGSKSRMVMTVHDELPTEVHESELATFPRQMQAIMQDVFKSNYVPITASMEWSDKSLGDKKKGFPV